MASYKIHCVKWQLYRDIPEKKKKTRGINIKINCEECYSILETISKTI